MNTVSLNLARKWRSKNFDTIIGQDLSVRMLKNSLYLGQFFPVYLFSGQRGCGKTSTARVFAAAVNCEKLAVFQESPKQQSIPCGACASCSAMLTGKHPDFIEIDAASNTGVDNVRQIIEASSLLPLLGRKKIYLIDEAHMLSKAAFNAFLKILEEPPTSVLFMLATTDPQKIIETVRSRCFQLFFAAVSTDILKTHLAKVCEQESITYEESALVLIIQQSDGSVRDALNLLEQVRFSAPSVTKESVLKSLGQLSDEQLLQLFECVVYQNATRLLECIVALSLERYSVEKCYGSLLEMIRVGLWSKYGAHPTTAFDVEQVKKIVASVPIGRLVSMLQVLSDQELPLARTTKKYLLFETMLLRLCSAPSSESRHESREQVSSHEPKHEPTKTVPSPVAAAQVVEPSWRQFLALIEALGDPLLKSIFAQGAYESFNQADGLLTVRFSGQQSFYSDWITDRTAVWLPVLQTVFGETARLNPVFRDTEEKKTEDSAPSPVIAHETAKMTQAGASEKVRFGVEKKSRAVDVSDAQTWHKTALVQKYFSGTVTEISEG